MQAQLCVRAEQERANIERCAGLGGDKALVHLHQRLHRLQRLLRGHHRQAHADTGVLQALHIVPRTEQLHAAVRAAVCLQTLKDLGAVVEHTSGRRQGNILEGDDAGIVPALFITVVHDEHVVGIVDAEAQLVRGGQLHGVCCFGHADIHISFLPKNRKSN